jgi:hypothetical protein
LPRLDNIDRRLNRALTDHRDLRDRARRAAEAGHLSKPPDTNP